MWSGYFEYGRIDAVKWFYHIRITALGEIGPMVFSPTATSQPT